MLTKKILFVSSIMFGIEGKPLKGNFEYSNNITEKNQSYLVLVRILEYIVYTYLVLNLNLY